MHLLILGYSDIVRRRVLPAARALGMITKVSIASRSHKDAEYSDYGHALAASGADLVYVSGINSEHERWITHALEHDLHVMVDKPALLDVAAAEAAIALAQRRRRGLAEATVFPFHPQATALDRLLEPDRAATRVTAVLCLPPRPAHDFRMRADCGCGSLYDLGPYAAATSRLVFGSAPAHVDCRILTRQAVDTSFSVLLTQKDGGALAGHFGFVTTYQNRLSVLDATRAVDVDRFFTTVPDAPAALRVREQNREYSVAVDPADSFARFMKAFVDAIGTGDFDAFTRALLDDARVVARMRETARG